MIQSTPVTGGRGYRQRPSDPADGRRDRLIRHLLPALLLAAAAFGVGATLGALHRPAEQDVADDYAAAWARGDHTAMYELLTDEARSAATAAEFAAAHREAAATATATGLTAGRAGEPRGGIVPVPVAVRTRVFGTVRTVLELPVVDDGGERRVAWAGHLAFPGVREGERLDRRVALPERATLLAADGAVLAEGDARVPEDAETAASIAGVLGPVPDERAEELHALGVPEDAQVGVSGLERALDDELRGRPGGELLAGARTLARTEPRKAPPVRSTIAPRIQRAAASALAGRLGGVVALRVGGPDSGDVVAAAGIGLSGLQPPGSTFKIVTLAGALEAGITDPSRRYEVATSATLEGVELENANGEACGGTLIESFAHSCNSVFGPLGAELGAERLVAVTERFGFNRPPPVQGAATSTIPPPDEIGDDLAVGATAIGQGRMQASALQMALAAATIAEGGRLPRPTMLRADRPAATRAVSEEAARIVARGMRAVVRYGTGTAAALDGTAVAGKTGTAELRQTQGETPDGEPVASDATDTSAWFAAFAPAGRPRIAVAVLLVEAGAGGAVAAPAARTVLEAAVG